MYIISNSKDANFSPLTITATGLGIILQVGKFNRDLTCKHLDETSSRGDDFFTQLRRIEYQSARIAGNPNFDLNSKSTRNLMKEKSIDLLTGIVNFFNSALLFYNHNFFG